MSFNQVGENFIRIWKPEILKRQNKAIELIESSDLNALTREATIPGGNDSDCSEDQLDLDFFADNLVTPGMVVMLIILPNCLMFLN